MFNLFPDRKLVPGGAPARRARPALLLVVLGALFGLMAVAPQFAAAAPNPFLGGLSTVDSVASTVPANGDINPYGIATVPSSTGALVMGDVLVSNFNAISNLQGTGTTIMEISPSGTVSQFAQIDAAHLPGACPGGVGLTTALTVLRSGFVIVGSLPTSDGTSATAQAGCLIVLNANGHVVRTISGGLINGPWDSTALDLGNVAELLVTNVLNGTVAGGGNTVNGGTVVRLVLSTVRGCTPRVLDSRVIANGFAETTDPGALVIGPTGVSLNARGDLFIADSLNNRLAVVPNAVTRISPIGHAGNTVSTGGALNDPLGLTTAPNGNLIAANGSDGNLVEVTQSGNQVATKEVDPSGAGVLFGLTIAPNGHGVYFVDDGDNTLRLLH